jgi:hypothetical protein
LFFGAGLYGPNTEDHATALSIAREAYQTQTAAAIYDIAKNGLNGSLFARARQIRRPNEHQANYRRRCLCIVVGTPEQNKKV